MNYIHLEPNTWGSLSSAGNNISGYQAQSLEISDKGSNQLFIFKDEHNWFHLVIKSGSSESSEIDDPKINGLKVGLTKYKLADTSQFFIDIICEYEFYLSEFTDLVKEIAGKVLRNEDQPETIVSETIVKWMTFWGIRHVKLLSDENLIGLFCELSVLFRLMLIDPRHALQSWRGPFCDLHDFNFSKWNFEIKATRNSKLVHVINGLQQLCVPKDKRLAVVSFFVEIGDSVDGESLPCLITRIKSSLKKHPHLLPVFHNLLREAGYHPSDEEHYENKKIKVITTTLYEVDSNFPSLTEKDLTSALSPRVSNISYHVTLEGLPGYDFNSLNFGQYFF